MSTVTNEEMDSFIAEVRSRNSCKLSQNIIDDIFADLDNCTFDNKPLDRETLNVVVHKNIVKENLRKNLK
jgi:hypothetical protein